MQRMRDTISSYTCVAIFFMRSSSASIASMCSCFATRLWSSTSTACAGQRRAAGGERARQSAAQAAQRAVPCWRAVGRAVRCGGRLRERTVRAPALRLRTASSLFFQAADGLQHDETFRRNGRRLQPHRGHRRAGWDLADLPVRPNPRPVRYSISWLSAPCCPAHPSGRRLGGVRLADPSPTQRSRAMWPRWSACP